jgi:hypothetical protein
VKSIFHAYGGVGFHRYVLRFSAARLNRVHR